MAELTDEQIAAEERFLEGIPRWNIGALFLPPIWGPAHGFWAVARGVSKEMYVRRERIWAVVCVVIGCAMIGFATWYNLMIRPGLGA